MSKIGSKIGPSGGRFEGCWGVKGDVLEGHEGHDELRRLNLISEDVPRGIGILKNQAELNYADLLGGSESRAFDFPVYLAQLYVVRWQVQERQVWLQALGSGL